MALGIIIGWILIAIVAIVILSLAAIGGFFVWYMFLKEGAEGPRIWKEAVNERANQ